jgi:hypothetical protein
MSVRHSPSADEPPFVDCAADEMTFLVEMVVDLSVNCAEFL